MFAFWGYTQNVSLFVCFFGQVQEISWQNFEILSLFFFFSSSCSISITVVVVVVFFSFWNSPFVKKLLVLIHVECIHTSSRVVPEIRIWGEHLHLDIETFECQDVRWAWMVDQRQLQPKRSVLQAKFWPWSIPQINLLGSDCLWEAIQAHLVFYLPRQVCWWWG